MRPSHFLWHLFVVNMTVMYSTRQIVCCPKITKFGYIFQFFRWERKVVSFELEIKLSSVGNRPQCFPVDSDGLYTTLGIENWNAIPKLYFTRMWDVTKGRTVGRGRTAPDNWLHTSNELFDRYLYISGAKLGKEKNCSLRQWFFFCYTSVFWLYFENMPILFWNGIAIKKV